MNRPLALKLLLLAALCFATYAATLNIPLFEDDYPTLSLAQQYGAPGELADLFHNPVYRTRATTYWVMLAVYRLFGLAPWGYRLASLTFHILGTWLLYALARQWAPMRPAALWAAMFFAVEEGHQEAVVWFAGFTEPAMLVFGLCAMLCWLRAGESARGWLWNAAGVAAFALALLSKETAVILLPLFLLAAPRADWRRALRRLIPYALLGLVVAASILAQHGHSFRFTDGSFSLSAPFWITWPRGMGRLLWIWGWLALIAIAWARERKLWRAAGLALAWSAIGLLPYCFLTYSTQIPSRQTYLASGGLALLFGLAVAHLETVAKLSRKLLIAVVVVALAANIGVVWFRKRRQFQDRAAPTEQLIRTARIYGGPIWVQCFPRNHWIAEAAVYWGAGFPPAVLVWSEEEARRRPVKVIFCFRGLGQLKR
ncbi:MAG: glycosyltransferase family 39 protein [Bryobacteraceae bacterium]